MGTPALVVSMSAVALVAALFVTHPKAERAELRVVVPVSSMDLCEQTAPDLATTISETHSTPVLVVCVPTPTPDPDRPEVGGLPLSGLERDGDPTPVGDPSALADPSVEL